MPLNQSFSIHASELIGPEPNIHLVAARRIDNIFQRFTVKAARQIVAEYSNRTPFPSVKHG
jgi:hypothetical protein